MECFKGDIPAESVLMQCSLVVIVPGSSSPDKDNTETHFTMFFFHCPPRYPIVVFCNVKAINIYFYFAILR